MLNLFAFLKEKQKSERRPQWEQRSDFSSLVRPMRFERTAFGVGAGLSIDSPHIFRRKGAEFEQNQAFHANFLQVRAMRQGWCGRQDGR